MVAIAPESRPSTRQISDRALLRGGNRPSPSKKQGFYEYEGLVTEICVNYPVSESLDSASKQLGKSTGFL
jgi:hypothetical protein